jgi:hypothetical protein
MLGPQYAGEADGASNAAAAVRRTLRQARGGVKPQDGAGPSAFNTQITQKSLTANVLDPRKRRIEFRNWLEAKVQPRAAQRG